jgi:hypothetical protein
VQVGLGAPAVEAKWDFAAMEGLSTRSKLHKNTSKALLTSKASIEWLVYMYTGDTTNVTAAGKFLLTLYGQDGRTDDVIALNTDGVLANTVSVYKVNNAFSNKDTNSPFSSPAATLDWCIKCAFI